MRPPLHPEEAEALRALERDPERFIQYLDFRDAIVFRCPVTGLVLSISGLTGTARDARLGIRHVAHNWITPLRHLLEAGLRGGALREVLERHIAPRLLHEGQREMAMAASMRRSQSVDPPVEWLAIDEASALDPAIFDRLVESRAAIAALTGTQIRENQIRTSMLFGHARLEPSAYMRMMLNEFDLGATDDDENSPATKTAKKLLVSCLTAAQRTQFERTTNFDVRVGKCGRDRRSGRMMRVSAGRVHNVADLATGSTYCVASREPVPIYDQMLTQKLLLETDPGTFFSTANASLRGADNGAIGRMGRWFA
jgi:hypothetical protein